MTMHGKMVVFLTGALLWPGEALARKPARPRASRHPATRRPTPRRLVLTGSRPAAVGGYSGVTPGLPRMPRIHLPREAAKRCYITWTGFQLLPGGSRVFVQFNRRPGHRVASMGTRIAVTLGGCRVASWNNTRPLLTQFFPTPVRSVDLTRRRRRDPWTLSIVLKRPVHYSVTVTKLQGWTYLFLTFRHGKKAWTPRPAPRRRPPKSRPRRPARPIGPSP